jgi:MFS family permease
MDASSRTAAAIAAATLTNLPFGTIYAFSVFLRPMEDAYGVSRTELSIVFALATITLTLGMNGVPWLLRRYPGLPPAVLLALTGLAAGSGLMLVAFGQGFEALLLGYGVLFGIGGGASFIVVQQGLNQTLARPSGLANGYVVSLYPIGAMIGSPIFGWALPQFGLRATLMGLGVVVVCLIGGAAWLYRCAAIRLQATQSSTVPADFQVDQRVFARLFLVFFLAASSGLLVMSQAAGILHAYGANAGFAVAATSAITAAIAVARLAGGWLVDRYPVSRVAAGAHLWALSGAVLINLWPTVVTAGLALAMIGMGYGFISGCSAAWMAQYWPRDLFARLAARVYIAWCVAAICLPILAAWLFDRTGAYGAAIVVAAAGNLLGVWTAKGLPIGRQAC